MADNLGEKGGIKFYCELCDYTCCDIWKYDRHLLTLKHKNIYIRRQKNDNLGEINYEYDYKCDCGKVYKYRQSLWKHRKTCIFKGSQLSGIGIKEKFDEEDTQMLTSLVLEVVKQNKDLVKHNQDLTEKLVDICKSANSNNAIQNFNHSNNNNNNNKTFNLQVFLNETCKDAMNIMDFANSVQLQLSDLEYVGEVGYIQGISNIIIKNLNALDVNKRPVHCSDSKREILYIKDDNKWEKEDGERHRLKKAIKIVANKNYKLVNQFKEKHPDCIYSHSNKSDQYNKLIIEALGGDGGNDDDKHNKIIKKIAKTVVIDKNV
jgi:hypothetical protein